MIKRVLNNIRRWASLLFGKSKELDKLIMTQVSKEHYDKIEKWKEIYSGDRKSVV